MAVDGRNILNNQATNADHVTFAQAIHDMLIAAGLTQTSDTGQATIASLTRPAASAVSGYEMFRFSDTEQATLPIFIRVDYGSGSVQTNPALRIQVGTSTNGAGTVGGTFYTNTVNAQWHSATDSAAATKPAFAAYNNGYAVIAFGIDDVNSRGVFFLIERPKLQDGSRTTDGWILWARYSTTSVAYVFGIGRSSSMTSVTPASSGTIANAFTMPVVLGNMDDTVGADVALFPLPVAVGAQMRWSAMLAYRAASIAFGAQQTINIFTTDRNYRTLGGLATSGNTALAFPYY